MENVRWIINDNSRVSGEKANVDAFSRNEISKARNFHKKFDIYEPTPLARLTELSAKLGVKEFLVKDESKRFGLNAFKVLGGSYAIGNFLAEKLEKNIDEVDFDMLKSKETKGKLGDITFYTATDGNHGRGVAWAANQLGQKSVVYMPKGSSQYRLDKIKAEGADASITDMNYDEAVRLADKNAKATGGEVIQDTAWEGYVKVPMWIMQGYGTLMLEAVEQMKEYGIDAPTHVFLQAGVGAMAGAVQGMIASIYPENRPITAIVEPEVANCIFRSAENKKMTNVTGDMFTIMAGLACGEPNPIGWDIMKDYSDAFISCPEYVAADGMRVLGNPLGNDPKVISGESGAVTSGIVYEILTDENLKELKEKLKIDENSKILVISTEGDTDPDNYRKIVWDGEFSR
ncbi:MAG: diaminopropionate ammonia-lyase [Peptoanaerobacter stomatis]|uniref:diaminopropionate ammonia-lyase n=1 Tax=Peptoanaerobacter stomatis TaxID=796937 RepID=UPI003FA0B876